MAPDPGQSGLFPLPTKVVNATIPFVPTLEIIENPSAAIVALDPVRTRLLSELAAPASASNLSARLGLPRQKINYHLKALEHHHLVQPADTRKWGGLTERLLVASASSYLVAPSALGPAAPDPAKSADRLSAAYLIALAARVIGEVRQLLGKALETDKRLPTLSIDTEISFRSPEDRAHFTRDLTAAIANLAAHYHAPSAPGARAHRLITLAYPMPRKVNP